ncbi:DNA adenine methylase [Malaciobacter molluscorum LMG 25693]|uniref:site-specific DNA-methyltransferase (adenine-specific) n=1 Tax=Malaciobacter molluscorum LMG 25693 TaxID=870501 RepID=A0A2G1DEU2_9BACT|nr:DNA adenine methylase [Malaciobacter molluscorum]AXX91142.1 type II DNA methyltransferase [Malaciobacter molluscorum LMG 25693]AXX91890.1 type II DNA methyltransferase [Malaciobacter molluscorum LMG 25693]AXX93246.1 type II DNA methyltransferase [Malaciobacter molluscorum LMG 25693]PHO16856.1 DNA adenine methylase [Malaciobacter molluscorum LMG 25693]
MVATIKTKENRLSPILKWAGGKEQELKYIHPCLPKKINNYYEPFIGGGAVYFSLNANEMFINDKSHELINLYNAISTQDDKFFNVVNEMIHNWELLQNIIINNDKDFIQKYKQFSENEIDDDKVKNWVTSFVLKHHDEFNGMFDTNFNVNIENFLKEIRKNINNKMKRMKKIELEKGKLPDNDILDNMESALKSAFYMHFRYLYNNIEKYNIEHSFAVAIFFFIRNFAYSGMFRYNKSGGFNVPYGGIGYNRKNLSKKVDYLKTEELVEHLNKTTIDNLDFEDFFKKNKPKKDDFIFLDPPYDSEFSTYAQNEFTRNDQSRLANYLINDCKANWMMVIKNTDFIYELYNKEGIYMTSFDKKYLVSFQNRNDKNVEHLLITNYKIN